MDEDPDFARFGSGVLYLERRKISEILLNGYFRHLIIIILYLRTFGVRCPRSVKPGTDPYPAKFRLDPDPELGLYGLQRTSDTKKHENKKESF